MGLDGVLHRPVSESDLLATVKHLLSVDRAAMAGVLEIAGPIDGRLRGGRHGETRNDGRLERPGPSARRMRITWKRLLCSRMRSLAWKESCWPVSRMNRVRPRLIAQPRTRASLRNCPIGRNSSGSPSWRPVTRRSICCSSSFASSRKPNRRAKARMGTAHPVGRRGRRANRTTGRGWYGQLVSSWMRTAGRPRRMNPHATRAVNARPGATARGPWIIEIGQLRALLVAAAQEEAAPGDGAAMAILESENQRLRQLCRGSRQDHQGRRLNRCGKAMEAAR